MFYLYYLFTKYLCIISQTVKSPSSRGLGHCPFTAATGVRIPLGTPVSKLTYSYGHGFPPLISRISLNPRLEYDKANFVTSLY